MSSGLFDDNIFYMITSPEYHMKRLLAAGSGAIYQITKAFRNEEIGQYHNPEFTILEWYRPNFNMYDLINEVNDLLKEILLCPSVICFSYQEVFLKYLDIDPLEKKLKKKQLINLALKLGLNNAELEKNKDLLLQFLFTFGIKPRLCKHNPVVIYDFPASQAGLAKINKIDNRIAERFEIYFNGIELANGFHELTDVQEQKKRFIYDNYIRKKHGLPVQLIDKYFLAAMNEKIPECSGVAVGIDRLIMIALKVKHISNINTFSIENA